MLVFKNSAELDYPIERVFEVFKETAKKDFPKFNEKKPVGAKSERKLNQGNKKVDVKVEITGFEENSLYEVTTYHGRATYVSRYELTPLGENKTNLILSETQDVMGGIGFLNKLLANTLYKGKIKTRFYGLIEGLKAQIEAQ